MLLRAAASRNPSTATAVPKYERIYRFHEILLTYMANIASVRSRPRLRAGASAFLLCPYGITANSR